MIKERETGKKKKQKKKRAKQSFIEVVHRITYLTERN